MASVPRKLMRLQEKEGGARRLPCLPQPLPAGVLVVRDLPCRLLLLLLQSACAERPPMMHLLPRLHQPQVTFLLIEQTPMLSLAPTLHLP